MFRMQRMSLVLWIACKNVELQSGLGLQSFAKSMRRQTSSGRCSAVSRSIPKSKTWVVQSRQRSFQWYLGFENRSTNDAAVRLTLVASVFDQSRNRWVDKLRAGAVQPFLVWFTTEKHARLEQEKIFPMIPWFWKSIDKWRCSASHAAERPQSSNNREIDASANFERTLFSRFWLDSPKQKMAV